MKIIYMISWSLMSLILFAEVASKKHQTNEVQGNHNMTRHLVSVQHQSMHICTGVIISEVLVMLAAHCLYEDEALRLKKKFDLTIVAGLSQEFVSEPANQFRRIREIIIHKNFNPGTSANDVALLLLRDKITIDSSTKMAIKLPTAPVKPGDPYKFVGWGSFLKTTQPQPALAVTGDNQFGFFDEVVFVLESCFCKRFFGAIYLDEMICGKPENLDFQGPCSNLDSGPLIQNDTLIGFLIIGFNCAIKNFPGIFSDVYKHHKWIEDMKNETDLEESTDVDKVLGPYYVLDHPLAKHIVSIEQIKFPFVNYQFLCEGTIVSSKSILTTSNCLINKETNETFSYDELRVIVGSSNRHRRSLHGKIHSVKDIRFSGSPQTGLAMLILQKEIVEDSTYCQRIPLARTVPQPGQACIYVVWNKINAHDGAPDKLVFGEVIISNEHHCNLENKDIVCARDPNEIFERKCVEHQGAPLICDNTLSGIVVLDYGCGQSKDLSWYNHLQPYEEWIRENAGSFLLSSSICIVLSVGIVLLADVL